jgi:hypothetical protein
MARASRRATLATAATAALALLSTAALVGGCGAGWGAHHKALPRAPKSVNAQKIPGFGRPAIPTPPATGTTPDAAAVATIRAWSAALRGGDVRSAAQYFNLPSELINGAGTGGLSSLTVIHTLTQAEQAIESLPCGAEFISADQRGRYVNALFRLTGRPGPGGSSCGTGAGQTARTNFLIVRGRIIEWIRAPDDPGDNGGAPSPQPGGTPLV